MPEQSQELQQSVPTVLQHLLLMVMPVVIVWLLLNRFIPLWASPLAISLGFVLIGASPEAADFKLERFWPHLELVIPNFEFGAVVAIGVPLYLITMASQNLPGLADRHAELVVGLAGRARGWLACHAWPCWRRRGCCCSFCRHWK